MAEIHQYKFQAVAKFVMKGIRQKNLTDSEIKELKPVVKATIKIFNQNWANVEEHPHNVAPYAKLSYYNKGVWRFKNGEVWREGIDKTTEQKI